MEEFKRAAARISAVPDEHRLRVITLLFGGPKFVGELAAALRMQLAQVSYHLAVLREANIASAAKRGRFVEYSLHPSVYSAGADAAEYLLYLGDCRLIFPAADYAAKIPDEPSASEQQRLEPIAEQCVKRCLASKSPLDSLALTIEAVGSDRRLSRAELEEVRRRVICGIIDACSGE